VDKIRPLICMLSSDQSGEIVASARALARVLRGAVLDIHALADSVGNGKLSQADMKEIYDAGFEAGERSIEDKLRGGGVCDVDDVNHEDLVQMATKCAMHVDRLRNDRERDFIHEMVKRTARGRPLTEKQEDWLREIASRVRR